MWLIINNVDVHPIDMWWAQLLVLLYIACLRQIFVSLSNGRSLRVSSEHHWTGVEVAVEQQAAMDCCHHLFQRTLKRYLEAKNRGREGGAQHHSSEDCMW